MNTKKILHGSTILLAILLIAGIFALQNRSKDEIQAKDELQTVSQFTYVWISQEERISRTDLVVEAVITRISATHWNSSSGKEWQPDFPAEISMEAHVPVPFQIHTIDVEVIRVIEDRIGVEKNLTITVLGNSPLDGKEWADHHLQVGERVVLLLQEGEIGWEGGTARVIRLIGAPIHSYYKLAEDGRYTSEIDSTPMELDVLIDYINRHSVSNPSE